MKKAKVVLTTMVAASALFGANVVAYADDTEEPLPGTSKSVTSKGDILFKLDTTTNPPVDPTEPDPEEPVEPTDPETPPGTEGPLSIDHVSNLHFGEKLISAEDQTYYALLEKVKLSDGSEKEVPNYVQVTDKRATNEGWKLTVKQDNQFQTTEGTELKGAALKLNNGQVYTNTGNKADAPTPNAAISLVPNGEEVDVANAAKDQGMGLWTNAFGTADTAIDSISLFVPGVSAKEEAKYSTALTWTLSSTPI